jgi:ribosomal protein S19E (S16A)
MNAALIDALKRVQQNRAASVARKLTSELQAAGLVQRINGELCVTPRGAAILKAGGRPEPQS